MKILFICRHNVFRSRVAEEYMKKISKHEISSGGIIKFSGNMPRLQQEVCREFGLILPNQSKTLELENLREQDLIIIVADDVSREVFEHPEYNLKEVRKWEIKDVPTDNSNKENIRYVVAEVIKRVEELNKELKTEE